MTTILYGQKLKIEGDLTKFYKTSSSIIFEFEKTSAIIEVKITNDNFWNTLQTVGVQRLKNSIIDFRRNTIDCSPVEKSDNKIVKKNIDNANNQNNIDTPNGKKFII